MGRRGPAPKPAKLRLIEGARPDKVNQNEPVARDALPEPPDELTPEAREIWDYTIRELDFMGIVAAVDRDSLVCYCEAVVNHRKATALVAKGDILIKGFSGQPVRNPALAVQRDSAQTIRAFAQEFGLTPSARTRIEVRGDDNAADDNPFAASN